MYAKDDPTILLEGFKRLQLEVRPRSTSDKFPSRVLIGNCGLFQYGEPFQQHRYHLRFTNDVIEPDMNIITCFTREEYIVEFESRKFR